MPRPDRARVGEIRPSQLMFSFGIGAIIDLPKISVIVSGLEDWPKDPEFVRPITEDRLLQAVRYSLPEVKRMMAAPLSKEPGYQSDPFEDSYYIGVPVAAFPRWMVCPECRLLAPLNSNLFELKTNLYHQDRTAYRHTGCPSTRNRRDPDVVPARFLVACEKGHLDDFPWIQFVHRNQPCDRPILRLLELGPSGEARDLEARCENCGAKRRLAEAFGRENREKMPNCRGRRPHLRDFDLKKCEHKMRAIVLGASNMWFPVVQSTIAIPVHTNKLDQLIEDRWGELHEVTESSILRFLRNTGGLGELADFEDDEIWEAIKTKRQQDAGELPHPEEVPDIKEPEWEVLTNFDPNLNTPDFSLRPIPAPQQYSSHIEQVVLVERLREVRAMIGFSRLDSLGEITDPDLEIETEFSPISRNPATWVPANEVRGEGIFIQFNEDAIRVWSSKSIVRERENDFFDAHRRWGVARNIENPEEGFPGMRYVLIHSFAHILMRQLALECGYSAASIRERLYVRSPSDTEKAMTGVLFYTSTQDSEGTLGGLVSLGETETLGRHIAQALELARLCASDPLCAEHPPSSRGITLHAAACHACLFAPETACERGNKYLDRSTLVETVEISDLAFFE